MFSDDLVMEATKNLGSNPKHINAMCPLAKDEEPENACQTSTDDFEVGVKDKDPKFDDPLFSSAEDDEPDDTTDLRTIKSLTKGRHHGALKFDSVDPLLSSTAMPMNHKKERRWPIVDPIPTMQYNDIFQEILEYLEAPLLVESGESQMFDPPTTSFEFGDTDDGDTRACSPKVNENENYQSS